MCRPVGSTSRVAAHIREIFRLPAERHYRYLARITFRRLQTSRIRVRMLISGTNTFDGPEILGGTTTVSNLGAILLNATSSINALTLTLATLGGTGAVTLTGVSTWGENGTMSGTGQTTIAAGATLNVTNTSSSITLSRTLVNNGTVNWTGADPWGLINGTIQNNGSFIANNINGSIFSGGGTNAFNNAGTFTKQGSTTTSLISAPFNNSGSRRCAGRDTQPLGCRHPYGRFFDCRRSDIIAIRHE